MNNRMCQSIWNVNLGIRTNAPLTVAVIAICGLLSVLTGCGSNSAAPSKPPSNAVRYRLVNVEIPADSPLRHDDRFNHPPNLCIVIKEDGHQIGNESTRQVGWSVDFPKGDSSNEWSIRLGTQNRFLIEIWDDNWGTNDLVLSIPDLTGDSFRDVIYEKGSKITSKDRLVRVTFAEVTQPAVTAPSQNAGPPDSNDAVK